jgi:hypothetical protein
MFEELCESGPDFELADIVFGVMENKSLEGDDQHGYKMCCLL